MTAVIVPEFTTEKEPAAIPPKVTEEIPVKLLPEIVTVFPLAADVGEKEVTTGTGRGVPI
jgi:hypothetical protein